MHARGGAERGERVARARDDERARALAEQRGLAAVQRSTSAPSPPRDARTRPARPRAPPSATSCAERSAPDADGLADRGVERAQLAEVGRGQLALGRRAAQLRQLGARCSDGAQPRAAISATASPALREAEPAGPRGVGQLADHADDGRREDRAAAALVVERDVPAHDGHAERAARVAQARHRARQLPRDVRLLGVAEVQAVRRGRAARRRRRRGSPSTRAPPRPRRGRGRRRRGARCRRSTRRAPAAARRRREHQHGGVGLLGPARGARADDAVVLLEHRAARGDVRRAEQREQRPAAGRRRRRARAAARG